MKLSNFWLLIFLFWLPRISIYSQTYHSNTNKDESLKHVSLFNTTRQDTVDCFRIPSVVTAPNGDIVAAIDQRVPSCADLRGNTNINIVVRRSSDNGKSWSDIETAIDYPEGISASDPSMIVDKNTGIIFLFYNYMDLVREPQVYYLKYTTSCDNGKSWGTPVDITSQISKPEWHHDFKFITSGRGIQTQSGTLLHTLVNLNHGLHLFGSNDHGLSWFVIDTPITPADESIVMELADNTLMINSRVNKIGMRYVHRSIDQGKTWVSQADSSLIDPGCNAGFIRYTSTSDGFDKNRLLFSNVNCKNDRKNLSIRISYDEGKTWSEGKTVYEGSSAYSALTVLNNGDILIFFEKDDYTDNAIVVLSLDWITDGKDRIHKIQPNK